MSADAASFFAHTLADWFAGYGRDLPWRHAPTPYQVWVSELMLQQTQVVTVIPYYNKWMARFPTVESLADASIEEVNGLWAGLGYYRRARYLHEGARVVVDSYGGVFPSDISQLQKITGIGAYTAGAIAAFAFGQDVPAIDGNAERVLSRYGGIYGDLSHGEPRRRIGEFAQKVVQIAGGAVINQAIMDLGATICRKKADCDKCPLKSQCYACRNALAETLPQKKAKSTKWLEYRAAILLESADHRYLVAMTKSDALLGNLNPALGRVMPKSTDIEITHIFTHIRMHILVDCAKLQQSSQFFSCAGGEYEKYDWLTRDQILAAPISTMMKKVVLRMPD